MSLQGQHLTKLKIQSNVASIAVLRKGRCKQRSLSCINLIGKNNSVKSDVTNLNHPHIFNRHRISRFFPCKSAGGVARSETSNWGGDGGSKGPPTGGGGGGGGFGDGYSSGDISKPDDKGFWATIWASYMAALEDSPVLTKSLTAAILNLVADLFCQLCIEKSNEIEWRRLSGFVLMGFFLSGPVMHFWYGGLSSHLTNPVLRVVCDQLLFAPMSMVACISILLTFEGKFGFIENKLKKDLMPTLTAQWKVWIPFQLLNFMFIPPPLRVAAANLIGVIWTVYMSYALHNDLA